jgi:hypothetical protein
LRTKENVMDPVFVKLNLGANTEILVLEAPSSFEAALATLGEVRVWRRLSEAKIIRFALAFVTQQSDVDNVSQRLVAKAPGDAILWFAYPKSTSKKYRCDFNRDSGWAVLKAAGFETVRAVAIDEDWTALRFRRVEFIKNMTRVNVVAKTKLSPPKTGRTTKANSRDVRK